MTLSQASHETSWCWSTLAQRELSLYRFLLLPEAESQAEQSRPDDRN